MTHREKTSSIKASSSVKEDNNFLFLQPAFIHPLIIQDLHSGIPDYSPRNEQIVAIALQEPTTIPTTHRYASTFYQEDSQTDNKDISPTITYIAENKESPWKFSYRLLGSTSTGLHALHTTYEADNIPPIHNLLVVMLAFDNEFLPDDELYSCKHLENEDIPTKLNAQPRLMIKRMGQITMNNHDAYRFDDIYLENDNKFHFRWKVKIALPVPEPSKEKIFTLQLSPESENSSEAFNDLSRNNSNTPPDNHSNGDLSGGDLSGDDLLDDDLLDDDLSDDDLSDDDLSDDDLSDDDLSDDDQDDDDEDEDDDIDDDDEEGEGSDDQDDSHDDEDDDSEDDDVEDEDEDDDLSDDDLDDSSSDSLPSDDSDDLSDDEIF